MATPPPTDDDLAFAASVCAGELDLTGAWSPQLRAVGWALPEMAERSWFGAPKQRVTLARAILKEIWPWIVTMCAVPTKIPWPVTAAGALEALRILRHEPLPNLQEFHAADEVRRALERLQRPRVYALLHGGTPPGRVMRHPAQRRAVEDPQICQELARSFLGMGAVHWTLDSPAHGESCMAGYLVREVAQLHPDAFRPFEPIGITGELDGDGNAVAVDGRGIPDKVEQFFRHHPSGMCFLPIKNLHDCPRVRKQPLDDHAARIFPFWNLTELFVRVGVVLPEKSITSFFEDVRVAAAHKLVDWRQKERALGDLVELSMKVEPGSVDTTWRNLIVEARLAPRPARLVVQGPPGAGKSFMLRQLHAALCGGALRLDGPSVLIRAKDLPNHSAFPAAVSLELQRSSGLCRWSGSEIARFFDVASSPVAATAWLLIDGLDEVPAVRRECVIEFVRKWPGRVCIATRRIREEIAGARVVNIVPLGTNAIYDMLRKEGRPDLVNAISGLQYQVESRAPVLSVINQLTATPLGVSLLADSVREINDLANMTRHALLGSGIDALLRRAVRERELDEEIVQLFHLETDSVLGATAWQMLLSGKEEFSLGDLRKASTPLKLGGDQLQKLLRTIDAGGIVQPSGANHREFVIRSFAEYSAALYVLQSPDRLELLKEGLPYLDEPSINEVFIQVASQSEADPVVELLLGATDQPITALDLASSLLLDVKAGQLYEDTIVEVLKRRVAIETRFGRRDENMAFSLTSGRTLRVIKRFPMIASRHIGALIDASHPGMRSMIEGDSVVLQPCELPCPIHERYRAESTDLDLVPEGVASSVELFLELAGRSPPLRTYLFLSASIWDDVSINELKRRYPTHTDRCLEELLNDPIRSVREEALSAWLLLSTDEDIYPRLPEFMTRGDSEVKSVLRHVVSRCGLTNRREAVLRYVLNLELVSDSIEIPQELYEFCDSEEPSDAEVAVAWDLAWDSGVLGWLHDPSKWSIAKSDELMDRGVVQTLAHAYSFMLDDPRLEARLSALSVWELIERNRWRRPLDQAHVTRSAPALFQDPFLEIRCKTLDFLVERRELAAPLPKPLLRSDDDRERWLAWRYFVRSNQGEVDVGELVRALRPGAYKYEVDGTPYLPGVVFERVSWGFYLIDADGALRSLLDTISIELAKVSFVKRLAVILKKGPHRKEARALLEHMARRCHRRRDESNGQDATLDSVCELLEPFLPLDWGPPIDDYFADFDDDSFDDPEWDYDREVQQLLNAIMTAPNRAAARDQLLARALEGDEYWGYALDALKRSGGINVRHKEPIIAHLRDYPSCADALELFFKAGGAEGELFDLWEELEVPWLPALRRTPTTS